MPDCEPPSPILVMCRANCIALCRGDENGYALDYLLSQPKPKEENGALKYIEDTLSPSAEDDGEEDIDMDEEWHGLSSDSE